METSVSCTNIGYRENAIKLIKKELLSNFNKNEILSAFIYGSTLCEDFCETSDFDILVIFYNASLNNLEKLKNIKEYFVKRNIQIDFNVHSEDDIPKNRMEAFWHNNRGLYFRKEIELYGRVIIGENTLLLSEYNKDLLQLEVVRVLNSLVYQSRKCLINKSIERKNLIQILKWCIYAAQYSLAYKDIFPSSKTEAMKIFKDVFNTKSDPQEFLNLKISSNIITYDHIQKAYDFLCEIDKIIINDWKLKDKNI